MKEDDIIDGILDLKIETPSWAYGNSGTRFATFPWPGAARNIWEKIDDASYVNKITGAAPRIALHIPWDAVDDYSELGNYAREKGLEIGAINPNLFQDPDYKLGSLCNPDPDIRNKALDHVTDCIEICELTGADILSLWLADGTNYFGQDDLVARRNFLIEALFEIYEALPSRVRMLIEYKFYEPSFYHTDIPDWGTSLLLSRKLGEKAQVLIDTGHHPLATNVEQIVANLIDERALGGFHFNSRNYGDDDLVVGASNPFQLYRIFHEIVEAELSSGERAHCAENIAYMIDQSHCIEGKIEPMIKSIVNCQRSRAKALLTDRDRLRELQREGDVMGAHEFVMESFRAEVSSLLDRARRKLGIQKDPIRVYRKGDYRRRMTRERGVHTESEGGYPE